MQPFEKLEAGKFYHIYNHAVGKLDLFKDAQNYEHFLSLYDKYISPVADTYAWVLMKNHFHVMVRIKEEKEVGFYKNLNSDRSADSVRFQTTTDLSEFGEPERVDAEKLKQPIVSRHFSHLFNAYSRYLNNLHQTTGALFERPFKRKLIDTDEYLRQVILYIHNNPVLHGFCSHPLEYPWSSYLTCTSDKATKLKRDEVIAWFGGKTNCEEEHRKIFDPTEMDIWLGV